MNICYLLALLAATPPQPVQQPAAVVGQEHYMVVGKKGGWIDANKDLYDVTADWNRRVLYTAPVPATCAYCAVAVDGAPVPAAGVQPTVPTDISARLREYAGNPGYSHNDYADTMRIAADECERFYGGMMAWKKTAETKDRKLSEEINARISERVEARLTEQAAGVMPRPSDDALWDETIRNRDYNADVADQLAACIAEYFGADIGEHSSANDPWHEAMRVIEEAPPLVVQQPDSGRDAALVRVLEGYAKNYDMMSRIGKTGDVDCRSVAHDIRRNMVDGIRKVLAAHPAPSSDAVLVHKAQSILAKHLPPDGPDANTTIRSLLDLLDGPESRTTHPANGAREAAEQRQRERVAEKFANRKATPATADFDLPAPNDSAPSTEPVPRRSKFEAWYTPLFGEVSLLGDSGQYRSNHAQGLWCAWKAALAAHPANGARAGLSDAHIREIFIANGFTVKEGQGDLKDYVYKAAHALLAAAKKAAAPQKKEG